MEFVIYNGDSGVGKDNKDKVFQPPMYSIDSSNKPVVEIASTLVCFILENE